MAMCRAGGGQGVYPGGRWHGRTAEGVVSWSPVVLADRVGVDGELVAAVVWEGGKAGRLGGRDGWIGRSSSAAVRDWAALLLSRCAWLTGRRRSACARSPVTGRRSKAISVWLGPYRHWFAEPVGGSGNDRRPPGGGRQVGNRPDAGGTTMAVGPPKAEHTLIAPLFVRYGQRTKAQVP